MAHLFANRIVLPYIVSSARSRLHSHITSLRICPIRYPRPSNSVFTSLSVQAHLREFTTTTNMAPNTPLITLNNGQKMPQVGFGLWKVENEKCADIVYNAIKAGYRCFDGACGTYLLLTSFIIL
jgi:hypothetical protein